MDSTRRLFLLSNFGLNEIVGEVSFSASIRPALLLMLMPGWNEVVVVAIATMCIALDMTRICISARDVVDAVQRGVLLGEALDLVERTQTSVSWAVLSLQCLAGAMQYLDMRLATTTLVMCMPSTCFRQAHAPSRGRNSSPLPFTLHASAGPTSGTPHQHPIFMVPQATTTQIGAQHMLNPMHAEAEYLNTSTHGWHTRSNSPTHPKLRLRGPSHPRGDHATFRNHVNRQLIDLEVRNLLTP